MDRFKGNINKVMDEREEDIRTPIEKILNDNYNRMNEYIENKEREVNQYGENRCKIHFE